jgi:hypothetical protein
MIRPSSQGFARSCTVWAGLARDGRQTGARAGALSPDLGNLDIPRLCAFQRAAFKM